MLLNGMGVVMVICDGSGMYGDVVLECMVIVVCVW